jgi:uncharacterized SAM-binding protein YcdF (DUF218 family)
MNAKQRGGLAVSGLVVLLLVFSHQILLGLGALLVNAGAPEKADIVVVIGGDWQGTRILKAAELAREGYAPQVLVSGVGGLYGHHESDVAIDFAVSKGYPRDAFVAFHYPALSTKDEARAVLRELHARGVHRYLLVTSEFHTARAGRIFRREAPDLELHVVAAKTLVWGNGAWWRNREGQKLWFGEFEKTIADHLGI